MVRQCTGCGKRYEATRQNCPHCWTHTWVFAPAGPALAPLPTNPYPCPECGYYAAAGTPACPHCRTHLRPRLLELFCLLGLLTSPAAIVYVLITHLPTRNVWLLPEAFIWTATALACWGLWRGSYSGFRAMQGVLIGGPLLLVVLIVVAEITGRQSATAELANLLLARLAAGVLLFLLLLHRAIGDYCVQGKPRERYQAGEMLLEEPHPERHRHGSGAPGRR